jgi:hypothetical protein
VLKLQGSGLCDLKPDRCVASAQINSYLEPTSRLFCLLCKKKKIFCLLCKERKKKKKSLICSLYTGLGFLCSIKEVTSTALRWYEPCKNLVRRV